MLGFGSIAELPFAGLRPTVAVQLVIGCAHVSDRARYGASGLDARRYRARGASVLRFSAAGIDIARFGSDGSDTARNGATGKDEGC